MQRAGASSCCRGHPHGTTGAQRGKRYADETRALAAKGFTSTKIACKSKVVTDIVLARSVVSVDGFVVLAMKPTRIDCMNTQIPQQMSTALALIRNASHLVSQQPVTPFDAEGVGGVANVVMPQHELYPVSQSQSGRHYEIRDARFDLLRRQAPLDGFLTVISLEARHTQEGDSVFHSDKRIAAVAQSLPPVCAQAALHEVLCGGAGAHAAGHGRRRAEKPQDSDLESRVEQLKSAHAVATGRFSGHLGPNFDYRHALQVQKDNPDFVPAGGEDEGEEQGQAEVPASASEQFAREVPIMQEMARMQWEPYSTHPAVGMGATCSFPAVFSGLVEELRFRIRREAAPERRDEHAYRVQITGVPGLEDTEHWGLMVALLMESNELYSVLVSAVHENHMQGIKVFRSELRARASKRARRSQGQGPGEEAPQENEEEEPALAPVEFSGVRRPGAIRVNEDMVAELKDFVRGKHPRFEHYRTADELGLLSSFAGVDPDTDGDSDPASGLPWELSDDAAGDAYVQVLRVALPFVRNTIAAFSDALRTCEASHVVSKRNRGEMWKPVELLLAKFEVEQFFDILFNEPYTLPLNVQCTDSSSSVSSSQLDNMQFPPEVSMRLQDSRGGERIAQDMLRMAMAPFDAPRQNDHAELAQIHTSTIVDSLHAQKILQGKQTSDSIAHETEVMRPLWERLQRALQDAPAESRGGLFEMGLHKIMTIGEDYDQGADGMRFDGQALALRGFLATPQDGNAVSKLVGMLQEGSAERDAGQRLAGEARRELAEGAPNLFGSFLRLFLLATGGLPLLEQIEGLWGTNPEFAAVHVYNTLVGAISRSHQLMSMNKALAERIMLVPAVEGLNGRNGTIEGVPNAIGRAVLLSSCWGCVPAHDGDTRQNLNVDLSAPTSAGKDYAVSCANDHLRASKVDGLFTKPVSVSLDYLGGQKLTDDQSAYAMTSIGTVTEKNGEITKSVRATQAVEFRDLMETGQTRYLTEIGIKPDHFWDSLVSALVRETTDPGKKQSRTTGDPPASTGGGRIEITRLQISHPRIAVMSSNTIGSNRDVRERVRAMALVMYHVAVCVPDPEPNGKASSHGSTFEQIHAQQQGFGKTTVGNDHNTQALGCIAGFLLGVHVHAQLAPLLSVHRRGGLPPLGEGMLPARMRRQLRDWYSAHGTRALAPLPKPRPDRCEASATMHNQALGMVVRSIASSMVGAALGRPAPSNWMCTAVSLLANRMSAPMAVRDLQEEMTQKHHAFFSMVMQYIGKQVLRLPSLSAEALLMLSSLEHPDNVPGRVRDEFRELQDVIRSNRHWRFLINPPKRSGIYIQMMLDAEVASGMRDVREERPGWVNDCVMDAQALERQRKFLCISRGPDDARCDVAKVAAWGMLQQMKGRFQGVTLNEHQLKSLQDTASTWFSGTWNQGDYNMPVNKHPAELITQLNFAWAAENDTVLPYQIAVENPDLPMSVSSAHSPPFVCSEDNGLVFVGVNLVSALTFCAGENSFGPSAHPLAHPIAQGVVAANAVRFHAPIAAVPPCTTFTATPRLTKYETVAAPAFLTKNRPGEIDATAMLSEETSLRGAARVGEQALAALIPTMNVHDGAYLSELATLNRVAGIQDPAGLSWANDYLLPSWNIPLNHAVNVVSWDGQWGAYTHSSKGAFLVTPDAGTVRSANLDELPWYLVREPDTGILFAAQPESQLVNAHDTQLVAGDVMTADSIAEVLELATEAAQPRFAPTREGESALQMRSRLRLFPRFNVDRSNVIVRLRVHGVACYATLVPFNGRGDAVAGHVDALKRDLLDDDADTPPCYLHPGTAAYCAATMVKSEARTTRGCILNCLATAIFPEQMLREGVVVQEGEAVHITLQKAWELDKQTGCLGFHTKRVLKLWGHVCDMSGRSIVPDQEDRPLGNAEYVEPDTREIASLHDMELESRRRDLIEKLLVTLPARPAGTTAPTKC